MYISIYSFYKKRKIHFLQLRVSISFYFHFAGGYWDYLCCDPNFCLLTYFFYIPWLDTNGPGISSSTSTTSYLCASLTSQCTGWWLLHWHLALKLPQLSCPSSWASGTCSPVRFLIPCPVRTINLKHYFFCPIPVTLGSLHINSNALTLKNFSILKAMLFLSKILTKRAKLLQLIPVWWRWYYCPGFSSCMDNLQHIRVSSGGQHHPHSTGTTLDTSNWIWS